MDRLTAQTVELLQVLIRNRCVNDGTAASGLTKSIWRSSRPVLPIRIVVNGVVVQTIPLAAQSPPPTLPMWLFPWLSYVAIGGMALVLAAMAVTPSHFAEFWASAVSIAVALIAYALFRRGRYAKPQPSG